MKVSKLIGYGVLIYAVAFVLVSVFVGFKVPTDNMVVKVVTVVAVLIATLLCAMNVKAASVGSAIVYSIVWLIIVLILDLAITSRFTGMQALGQWDMIAGYLIIFLVPLLAVKKSK